MQTAFIWHDTVCLPTYGNVFGVLTKRFTGVGDPGGDLGPFEETVLDLQIHCNVFSSWTSVLFHFQIFLECLIGD